MRLAPALLALFAAAPAVLLPPAPARADLLDDAQRLIDSWSQRAGTSVDHRSPLFLERGRVTSLYLGDAKPKNAKAGCVTVVLLAPRTSELAMAPESAGEPPPSAPAPVPVLPSGHPAVANDDGEAVRSKAGVAMLERCGKDEAAHPLEAERLLVNAGSPRTAVEVLVVRSPAPIESVERILPERAFGPSAPRGDAGRQLDPGPIAERIARVEKRDRDDGAENLAKATMTASATGSGEFDVKLREGCHTLDVMAEVPSAARTLTDVDAEAHAGESARLLGRDRGESPDARLNFCVGDATDVEVTFIGAASGAAVTLVDALWSLPAGIPTEWGAQARGDVASALRRRHAASLPPAPIQTVMGVQGETLVPFAVEPGQCYVAAASMIRGETRLIGLSIEIGDRAPHDEITDRPEAAMVAFCATAEDHAAMRVEARGGQPWWLGLLWRVTR